MKTLVIILLLSLTIDSSAQLIKGTVIDKDTNPIQFVSIGIINRNYGTISDDNGNFSFDLNRINLVDTLRFSSIGYKSKDFSVSEIKNTEHFIVLLDDNIYQINQVQIKPNSEKPIEFGQRKVHKDGGFGFGGVGEGCEVANLFSNAKSIWLKEFQFHLNFSNYDSIMFRLNIYSYRDSLPFIIINSVPIYIITSIDNGWITKDLRKYDLNLNDNFVISLEPVQCWGIKDPSLKNKLQIVLSGKVKNNKNLSYSRIFSLGYWRKSKMFMDYYLTAY